MILLERKCRVREFRYKICVHNRAWEKKNLSRDGLRTYTEYTEQVYWLLLHERQPQTQKLKPAHTNTHSVCGSGLSTARLVSQLTRCKQCWLGLDPV